MNTRWKSIRSIVAALKVVAGIALLIGLSLPAHATSVMQMNLAQLCDRAGQIFSGTVIEIKPDTVQAGGGDMPVLRYRIRVDESFKGTFAEEKGVAYADITMIGTIDQTKAGTKSLLPTLQEGKQYLLMVAPNGPAGITSTVGLIQGTFSLSDDKIPLAVNGADNVGLFSGMNISNNNSTPNSVQINSVSSISNHQRGPIPYNTLAELIRNGLEAN